MGCWEGTPPHNSSSTDRPITCCILCLVEAGVCCHDVQHRLVVPFSCLWWVRCHRQDAVCDGRLLPVLVPCWPTRQRLPQLLAAAHVCSCIWAPPHSDVVNAVCPSCGSWLVGCVPWRCAAAVLRRQVRTNCRLTGACCMHVASTATPGVLCLFGCYCMRGNVRKAGRQECVCTPARRHGWCACRRAARRTEQGP